MKRTGARLPNGPPKKKPARWEELTPREQAVARLIVFEELGNKEIQQRLRIGHSRLQTHVSSIYRLLRVNGRVGLAYYMGQNRKELQDE